MILLFTELNECYSAKISIVLLLVFVQLDSNGQYVDELVLPFRDTHFVGVVGNNLTNDVQRAFINMREKVDGFVQNGSNWILERVLETRLEFAR